MADDVHEAPKGAVPLAEAIGALRDELTGAWWGGRDQAVRFRPSPVELTLQVGVTSGGKARAGVKWWLIDLGGELSRQSVTTQIVKVTLEPVMFDDEGKPVEFLIDAVDDAGSVAGRAGEVPLDAPG